MNPLPWKSVLGAATVLALAGRMGAADLSPANASAVESTRPMQMPPFIVEDTPSKFATWKWGYTSFPGYEVMTYCDDAVTMRFITGLSRQISILGDIAPAAFESAPSVPTALILMDRTQEQTIAEGMKKVMTERTGSLNTKTSGLSVHRVFFPQLLLHDSESTAINVILDDWDNYDTVVLEPGYVRYLLELRLPHLPAWYVDAMTTLYAHALFLPTKVVFSPVEWPLDEVEAKASHADPSHPRALVPLNAILLTHPTSEGFDDESRARVRRWKAEAELFLHWVLADKSNGRIRALKRYFDLGTAGRRESAFRECFGLGYAEAANQLSQYLPKAVNETITVYRDDDVPIAGLRDATDAEYARIWGNWGLMEIEFVKDQDPLMVHPYIAQAEHTLGGAYRKGEREPRFMAVLGLHDVGMNRPDEARVVMESAAAEKVNYPAMYVELARLRFRQAIAKP
ncbi:MAG TPA: hypothetical protein VII09_01535, partial [Opitutaceae bacterium]